MSSSVSIDSIFGVKGKVVVITGGGTGLGKQFAQGFSANGAKVYIVGRRLEVLAKTAELLQPEAKAAGGQIIPLQGDVSSKDKVEEFVKVLSSKESHVDVVIACAGVSRQIDYPAWDHNNPDEVYNALWKGVDDEHFNFTNSINVNGVYFTAVGLVPLLRKSSAPVVIIIASLGGLVNQRVQGSMTYGISKAAALHMSKLLAGRLSPMKIRVNSIAPGIFPTEMTTTDGTNNPETLNKYSKRTALRCPAGRPGRPEEIIGPALFLASAAGGYVNGDFIMPDGGRAMSASITDGIRMPEDTYVQ